MKYIVLIAALFSFFGSFLAHADCRECANMQKLEQHFLSLQYTNSSQYDRGAADVLKVDNLMVRLAPQFERKNPDVKEFAALVHLVAAALPFDVETSLADGLSGFIQESPKLKSVYAKTLASIKDACRRQLLESAVRGHLCTGKSCDQDKDADFSYGACIGKSGHGGDHASP